jgi:EmrB/QacA subfamily drug resistance transporter
VRNTPIRTSHVQRPVPLSLQANPCDAGVIRAQRESTGEPCGRKRTALAATILGSSLAFIDGSVVNVALSSIQRDLSASVADVQWVVDAYLLLLGSLVLIGGAAGDKLGRRTIFVAGIVVFTGASMACGMAPNAVVLIVARGVQGIGAALLVPSSLAIVGAVFPKAERGQAIGTWAGAGAIMSAIGPVAGGWLIDALSWRAIFFINLPIALTALGLAIRAVPDSRAPDATAALDWPGAATAVAGLGALTYGLTIASTRGFSDAGVLASIGAGVALSVAFVFVEWRGRHPMVTLDIFRSSDFTGANAVTLLVYFGLGGALFFLPYTLTRARGYTAAEAGGALLPLSIVIGALSRLAGAVTTRTGPRLPLIAGPIVVGIGFAMLGWLVGMSSFWRGVFPALMVVASGMTITIAPLTTTVMMAVPDRRAGVASGVNNAVARIASLLAIAVLGVVFVRTHAGAQHTVQPLGTDAAQADALIEGMRAVALVCAACAFAGAGCAALTIRRRPR